MALLSAKPASLLYRQLLVAARTIDRKASASGRSQLALGGAIRELFYLEQVSAMLPEDGDDGESPLARQRRLRAQVDAAQEELLILRKLAGLDADTIAVLFDYKMGKQ